MSEMNTSVEISLSEIKYEMSILSEQNDWAEQDPNDWWTYLCQATKRILQESKIEASNIEAVGISYQMHGLVVDKDSEGLFKQEVNPSMYGIASGVAASVGACHTDDLGYIDAADRMALVGTVGHAGRRCCACVG